MIQKLPNFSINNFEKQSHVSHVLLYEIKIAFSDFIQMEAGKRFVCHENI